MRAIHALRRSRHRGPITEGPNTDGDEDVQNYRFDDVRTACDHIHITVKVFEDEQ